jgi:spore coat polysaccharide biosynthesis protein SpsF
MNIVVIVQARTGSTRLPGKILKKILDKPILTLQMERMLAAKIPTKVVIATTHLKEDDPIEDICLENNYDMYRGHPTDLLDRHYQAAKEFEADIAVKIPSDCPLIDPKVIDKVIQFYLDYQDTYDFVSNLHPPTYPDGNDVEVMPIKVLKKAWKHAEQSFELEHTTPYIWDRPKKFRIGNFRWETGQDFSMSHRFTIDYQEDFDFIKAVFEELYPNDPLFTLEDILDLLEQKPEIYKINQKYAGVNWYRNHLDELKTIKEEQTRRVSGR